MMQFNGLVYNFSLNEIDLPMRAARQPEWRPHDFRAAMHPNDSYGRAILDACITMHDRGHTVAIAVQESKTTPSRYIVRIALPRATMDAWDKEQGIDVDESAPPPVENPEPEFVVPARRMNFNRSGS